MNTRQYGTALVTGATSGIGYVASSLLAEAGFTHIIVTGRTSSGAMETAADLEAKPGPDIYEGLTLDLFDPESIKGAVTELSQRGRQIDFLVLNAGLVSGTKLTRTNDGLEVTFAASLIGHHRLVIHLLSQGLLAKKARIVISGSEAALGEVKGFETVDLKTLASKQFNGDCVAAAKWLIRNGADPEYQQGRAYSNAKLFVAWWAAALARRLLDGRMVNTISPGKAGGTKIMRNAPFIMRRIIVPLSKVTACFGRDTRINEAAARYLAAIGFSNDVNGVFFASAPGRMTGPLHRVEHSNILDEECQEAAWSATVCLSQTADLCEMFDKNLIQGELKMAGVQLESEA